MDETVSSGTFWQLHKKLQNIVNVNITVQVLIILSQFNAMLTQNYSPKTTLNQTLTFYILL